MPRAPRREAPGAIHHVVAQGNNRQAIVLDDRDRMTFVRRLADASSRFAWTCLAYCLMDTHAHIIVQTSKPNLGQGAGWLLGGYARWFNRRHRREGHLFVTPFFSRSLETDEHLVAAAAYVVVNPVSAGLCEHPSEWTWSSYRGTLEAGPPTFAVSSFVLGMLADNEEVARARYVAIVDEYVARVRRERAAQGRAGR